MLARAKSGVSNFSVTLPKQTSSVAPDHVWSNRDTDPTSEEQRTWTSWTWVGYWVSDIITISGWQKASSMVSLGLDWRQSLIVTAVGACTLATPMVLNGKIGAVLHICFPVAIRSSHGYYFAWFAIVSRIIVAFFWFGIQSWNGGTCVKMMLGAIWPSYLKLANELPKSAGVTTQAMLSYFLYWLIQLPFLFIHPSKLRYVFLVKAIVVPITALATMAWCIKQASGGGALLKAGPTVHGEAFASAWLLSMTSLIGGYSTVALNIPDFTRYAKKPMSQYMQAPLLPIFYIITALFGIISASCTKSFNHGTVLWSPVDIAALWDSRAARFFAGAAWLLAQISCNASANSISAASDLSTLFPRYINIRRGQIICALVGGWAMVPWKVLVSAKVFLNAISAYAVVLAPLAGIMCADFYLVKKQHINVPGLYDPNGPYRYNRFGTNWRAVAALLISIGPNLPGVIHVLKPSIPIGAIKWIYAVSWNFGFVVSIIVYTGLSWTFPDKSGSLVAHTTMAEDFLDSHTDRSNTPDDDEKISSKGDDVGVSAVLVNSRA